MLIQAKERVQGSNDEVLAAYRKLSTQTPKHPMAQQAKRAVNRIEAAQYSLSRQEPQENVRAYRIPSQRMESGIYTIRVEVAKAISQEELKATLEDCLLATYSKRPRKQSKVLIRGYYTYPLTVAGTVSWNPGNALKYQFAEQKAEDVITDAIFDLFKRK